MLVMVYICFGDEMMYTVTINNNNNSNNGVLCVVGITYPSLHYSLTRNSHLKITTHTPEENFSVIPLF